MPKLQCVYARGEDEQGQMQALGTAESSVNFGLRGFYSCLHIPLVQCIMPAHRYLRQFVVYELYLIMC